MGFRERWKGGREREVGVEGVCDGEREMERWTIVRTARSDVGEGKDVQRAEDEDNERLSSE